MRLIDADALIESIKHGLWDWETVNGIESRTVLKQTIQDIRNEPTIDAQPVRHGRWDLCEVDGLGKRVKCSICGEKIWTLDTNDERYCCHCGARMDEGMRNELFRHHR